MPTKIPANEQPPVETVDLAAEFAELGKKLRATVETAWGSQERRNIQKEIEEGLVRMRDELNAAAKNLRESEPGQKVEAKVQQVRTDVETGKIGDDVRKGMVTGLRAMGDALDKLSESFTPAETPKK